MPARIAPVNKASCHAEVAFDMSRIIKRPIQATSDANERENLALQIQRGRECLDLTRIEIADLRAKLEGWATFETTCGHNPLVDYAEKLSALEKVREFLPAWLARHERRLQEVSRRVL